MSKPHRDGDKNEIIDIQVGKEWVFSPSALSPSALSPSALSIVWGNDSRYWRMKSSGEEQTAELLQVCWLEITGSTKENLERGKKYIISFTISFDETFRWKDCPLFLMAKIGKKGKYKWQEIKLQDLVNSKEPNSSKPRYSIPSSPFIIEVDQNSSNEDRLLYFGLYEVWTGKWKEGLIIHNAIVQEIRSWKLTTTPVTF